MIHTDYDQLAGPDPASTMLPIVQAAIADCTGVAGMQRLTGGANQETWAIDAQTTDGPIPLILRRARGGTLQRSTGIGVEVEASVLRTAHTNGVPTPEVVYVLRPEDGLGHGFLMRRIAGETIPRKILRGESFAAIRPQLASLCGTALAKIHAVPTGNLDGLKQFTPMERLEWLRERYEETGRVSTVFAYAFAWLREHVPQPPSALSLVHGDFRNGNLIIAPDGINAVLDWENAHIGDPAEDFGWFCVPSWRFGNLDKHAGGFGTREELLAAYAAGGQVPTADRLRFWEAYGSLYWGVVCARSVSEFRSGADRSVERAMIARRVSEAELDLLRLITPRSR